MIKRHLYAIKWLWLDYYRYGHRPSRVWYQINLEIYDNNLK